jgi:hypothetical protein
LWLYQIDVLGKNLHTSRGNVLTFPLSTPSIKRDRSAGSDSGAGRTAYRMRATEKATAVGKFPCPTEKGARKDLQIMSVKKERTGEVRSGAS